MMLLPIPSLKTIFTLGYHAEPTVPQPRATMNVPRLEAPIILVHGLLGFDRIQVGGMTVANYFPGVRECLEPSGNRVLTPWLSPTKSIAERAVELKSFILRNVPEGPVHVIAHSMGGLDSRYMISKLDMGCRVLSLTTLGTPHRGCPFADWGIGKLEWMVRPVLDFLCVPHQAFYDLTTSRCKQFNDAVPNDSRVRYFSVGGEHTGSFFAPEWWLPYNIVHQAEGANDGVVSLKSAEWGESLDVWQGDHFSLVNWLHPLATNRGFDRDPAKRFGPLVERLSALGF